MKAAAGDLVGTTSEIRSGHRIIPAGTRGVVIETHTTPREAYLVELDGTERLRHAVLYPAEFEVLPADPSRRPDAPAEAPESST